MELPDASAAELFGTEGAAPGLRKLTIFNSQLTTKATHAVAAAGWRLEELGVLVNDDLGAAGVAALAASPTFALRHLVLANCGLDATSLFAVANAPWPLEELNVSFNDFSATEAGPALAALARHAGLCKLRLDRCLLSAGGFKALVEATWPALTYLSARAAQVALEGPDALGAAAYAGFLALEELHLEGVALGEAGARLLASRCWPRLHTLIFDKAQLGDAGVAALARGEWPALTGLSVRENGLSAPLALEEARRGAPKLVLLLQ